MKIKKRWIILMTAMTLIAIAGRSKTRRRSQGRGSDLALEGHPVPQRNFLPRPAGAGARAVGKGRCLIGGLMPL